MNNDAGKAFRSAQLSANNQALSAEIDIERPVGRDPRLDLHIREILDAREPGDGYVTDYPSLVRS